MSETDRIASIIEQIEQLNEAFFIVPDGSESEHAQRLIALAKQVPAVDFKAIGKVAKLNDDMTICGLHSTGNTVIAVNYLAPNATLPAHDHQSFFGVARVMQGSMFCESFGYAAGVRQEDNGTVLLRQESEGTLKEGDTSVILSDEGQLHRITAGPDGVAFMDIYAMRRSPGSCMFYDIAEQTAPDGFLKAKPISQVSVH